MRGADGWHLSEIPLFVPALGLICGIMAVSEHGDVPVWVCLAAIAAALTASILLRRQRAVFFLCGMMTGGVVMIAAIPVGIRPGTVARFEGMVVQADDYGDMQRCVVDVGGGRRLGIDVYGYAYMAEPGDSVSFEAMVMPAVRYTTVPDEQSGEIYAMVNRLSGRCKVYADDFVIAAGASGWRGWLNDVRIKLSDAIKYSGLSQPSAAFLGAILLGDDGMEPEVRGDFSRAGLAHVLALSGMHVSAIAMMVALLLLPVEMAGGRRGALAASLVFLWLYALVTGMSPSVVRAVVMASFVVVGRISGRRPNPFNSLCGAVIAILLFSPMTLFRPGFQLSVLAVAGILMFMPMFRDWFSSNGWLRHRLARFGLDMMLLPLVAMTVCGPLAAWHFHYFPIWFMAAAVPVAFLLPWFMGGGMLLALVSLAGGSSGWLIALLDWLYGMIGYIAGKVGNVPGVTCYFNGLTLLLLYVAMLLLWLGWLTHRKAFALYGAILAAFTGVSVFVARPSFTERECYVYKDAGSVNMLFREGNRVYIATDAAEKHHGEIQARAETRLRNYLGKRGATLAGVVSRGIATGYASIDRDRWQIGGLEIHFVRDTIPCPRDIPAESVVVVTAGFKRDISEIAANIPDCVLVLSPAMSPRRRKAAADKLGEMNYPFELDLGEWATADSRYRPSRK